MVAVVSTLSLHLKYNFVQTKIYRPMPRISELTICPSSVPSSSKHPWYVSNVSIILMLHACLCTICFVFCYTSWRFYAFSRTNLLTRCHSISSLFSAIFMFQKSYTGNILGIRRNKSQNSYFSRHETKSEGEPEGGHHTTWWRGWPLGRATLWCVGPICWYVSNVSIIFNAPCLFLNHFLSVSLHFVEFLCIFWN
jgi:hypothetical protein